MQFGNRKNASDSRSYEISVIHYSMMPCTVVTKYSKELRFRNLNHLSKIVLKNSPGRHCTQKPLGLFIRQVKNMWNLTQNFPKTWLRWLISGKIMCNTIDWALNFVTPSSIGFNLNITFHGFKQMDILDRHRRYFHGLPRFWPGGRPSTTKSTQQRCAPR